MLQSQEGLRPLRARIVPSRAATLTKVLHPCRQADSGSLAALVLLVLTVGAVAGCGGHKAGETVESGVLQQLESHLPRAGAGGVEPWESACVPSLVVDFVGLLARPPRWGEVAPGKLGPIVLVVPRQLSSLEFMRLVTMIRRSGLGKRHREVLLAARDEAGTVGWVRVLGTVYATVPTLTWKLGSQGEPRRVHVYVARGQKPLPCAFDERHNLPLPHLGLQDCPLVTDSAALGGLGRFELVVEPESALDEWLATLLELQGKWRAIGDLAVLPPTPKPVPVILDQG